MTIKHLAALAGLTMSSIVMASGGEPASDPIADAQASWAGRALDLQRDLDIYAPISTNSILGTHNTYNSEVYRDIDSYLDPQQKHSIYDQLRLGARFIELDAHWTAHTKGAPWNWGDDLLLCHSGIGVSLGSLHIGCSLTDRFLTEGIDEVKNWLNDGANAGEVIIMYIEDHTEGRHQELYNVINSRIGNKIYKSGGCKDIPSTLTKADVLAAGKQVIWWKDGGCSGNNDVKNAAFTGLGSVSRVFEDATSIAAIGNFFTGNPGNRLSAQDIRDAHKNGVNIVNLDDMTYNDGRNEAAIWSWDNNEPNNWGGNQDCAVQWGNGRWDDANCDTNYAYACNQPGTDNWKVTGHGSWTGGAAACAALGNNYEFSVPTNSKSNEALKAAKNGASHVWLNYNDRSVEGRWDVAIPEQYAYRALKDGRSGLCMDVAGGNSANGTNVRLWSCNGSNAQKWKYDAANGFLRSKLGNKCLDNRGQTYNGGGIQIWDCVNSNNLRFDWVGTSLRSRHNNNIAVDAYGSGVGANIGQWSYHGGPNQQWYWD